MEESALEFVGDFFNRIFLIGQGDHELHRSAALPALQPGDIQFR